VKAILSVLAQDRPGIVAEIASLLAEFGCNIENVSQTILQNEFAGIFVCSLPTQQDKEDLVQKIKKELSRGDLTVKIKLLDEVRPQTEAQHSEKYVLVGFGPDRLGQIAQLAKVLAKHHCNIINLQFVAQNNIDPNKSLTFFELEVPAQVNLQELRCDLQQAGQELQLEISLQHKKIFETLHRI